MANLMSALSFFPTCHGEGPRTASDSVSVVECTTGKASANETRHALATDSQYVRGEAGLRDLFGRAHPPLQTKDDHKVGDLERACEKCKGQRRTPAGRGGEGAC